MDFDDTEQEAAFRADARAWLEGNAPRRHEGARARRPMPTDEASQRQHVATCRQWQRTLAKGGWAGITWPTAFGGRGGTPVQQMIFSQEEAGFEVSAGALSVGLAMVGPTLMAWGTPEQQDRHLEPMLRGETLWCQLFSEPGAGSDLPSLITRAERDGDTYVVNGQKVWTSFAQFADWGILLARTGVGSGRDGISYFLVDMTTPGIEVRPLRQATGVAHFNEVFLTDVRVPAENMVGAEGQGWKVARTTLASERVSIGSGRGTTFADVLSLVNSLGGTLDALQRQEVARAYINFELLRYLGLRVQTSISQGRAPGAEGSILKLAISQQSALLGDLGMRLLGPAGAVSNGTVTDADFWREKLVGQWSMRIGGGTDQMQRNQIGERVLGLPREPKVI